MTEIKILAKENGAENVYLGNYIQGTFETCKKLISQETKNGKPKWEILIGFDHPELEKEREINVNVRVGNRQFDKVYCYEISFTDDESLLKKTTIHGNINEPPKTVVKDEDKNRRVFSPKSNITIKDKFLWENIRGVKEWK